MSSTTITRATFARKLRVSERTVIRWERASKLHVVCFDPYATYEEEECADFLSLRGENGMPVIADGKIPNDILTTEEAARILRIKSRALTQWLKDDDTKIPHYRITSHNIRFRKEYLIEWMEANRALVWDRRAHSDWRRKQVMKRAIQEAKKS